MIIRKGESIFYDFIKEDGSAILDSENVSWEIRDEANESLLTGAGVIIDDTFQVRIQRDDTLTLLEGYYTLLVGFINNDTGYYDYIMDEELQVIL